MWSPLSGTLHWLYRQVCTQAFWNAGNNWHLSATLVLSCSVGMWAAPLEWVAKSNIRNTYSLCLSVWNDRCDSYLSLVQTKDSERDKLKPSTSHQCVYKTVYHSIATTLCTSLVSASILAFVAAGYHLWYCKIQMSKVIAITSYELKQLKEAFLKNID